METLVNDAMIRLLTRKAPSRLTDPRFIALMDAAHDMNLSYDEFSGILDAEFATADAKATVRFMNDSVSVHLQLGWAEDGNGHFGETCFHV